MAPKHNHVRTRLNFSEDEDQLMWKFFIEKLHKRDPAAIKRKNDIWMEFNGRKEYNLNNRTYVTLEKHFRNVMLPNIDRAPIPNEDVILVLELCKVELGSSEAVYRLKKRLRPLCDLKVVPPNYLVQEVMRRDTQPSHSQPQQTSSTSQHFTRQTPTSENLDTPQSSHSHKKQITTSTPHTHFTRQTPISENNLELNGSNHVQKRQGSYSSADFTQSLENDEGYRAFLENMGSASPESHNRVVVRKRRFEKVQHSVVRGELFKVYASLPVDKPERRRGRPRKAATTENTSQQQIQHELQQQLFGPESSDFSSSNLSSMSPCDISQFPSAAKRHEKRANGEEVSDVVRTINSIMNTNTVVEKRPHSESHQQRLHIVDGFEVEDEEESLSPNNSQMADQSAKRATPTNSSSPMADQTKKRSQRTNSQRADKPAAAKRSPTKTKAQRTSFNASPQTSKSISDNTPHQKTRMTNNSLSSAIAPVVGEATAVSNKSAAPPVAQVAPQRQEVPFDSTVSQQIQCKISESFPIDEETRMEIEWHKKLTELNKNNKGVTPEDVLRCKELLRIRVHLATKRALPVEGILDGIPQNIQNMIKQFIDVIKWGLSKNGDLPDIFAGLLLNGS